MELDMRLTWPERVVMLIAWAFLLLNLDMVPKQEGRLVLVLGATMLGITALLTPTERRYTRR